MTTRTSLCAIGLLGSAVLGCGAGNENVAVQNRTFYANEFVSGVDVAAFEKRLPALDAAKLENAGPFEGYEILGGAMHISRPSTWKIRAASASPSGRYIVYLSPKQYLFGVYEQVDPPSTSWAELLKRYEKDVSANAKIIDPAVPFATSDAQGRAYVIQRLVPGARTPFINTAREIVLRNDQRVVLMQVVYSGDVLPELTPELMHVFRTLRLR
jgi:hypothetical protein